MRFLIVDDSSTMRRIIINTLNKLGHQDVAEAGNGREGLDRLSAGPVDLIITDWNMPEMSGIDFIRTVRSMPEVKDTPVLMVTTNAAKAHIKGIELETNAQLARDFAGPGSSISFAGTLGYIDAKYKTFIGPDGKDDANGDQ